MEVRELWRYPVKSCGGERVESTWIAASGLAGDRVVQPTTDRGERVTARRFPRLLGLKGTLGEDGTARSVLQRIVDECGGRFALDCYVIQEGAVREGDPVEIAGYWTLSPADLSLQIGDWRPAWIPPNDNGAKVVAPHGSVIAPATPSG